MQLKDSTSSDRTISLLSPYLNGFLSLADVASSILVPCCDTACACAMGLGRSATAAWGAWRVPPGMDVFGWVDVGNAALTVQTLPFFIFLPFFVLY